MQRGLGLSVECRRSAAPRGGAGPRCASQGALSSFRDTTPHSLAVRPVRLPSAPSLTHEPSARLLRARLGGRKLLDPCPGRGCPGRSTLAGTPGTGESVHRGARPLWRLWPRELGGGGQGHP